MKRYTRLLVPSALLFFCLYSCANTSTPPSGGPKDTIPPVMLKSAPDSNHVNFPLEDGTIELIFNEYVVLKEPVKNVFLSPPQKKKLKTKIRGKSIIINFEEPLDSATTYTVQFGSSIADNNEGNLFYPYVYPFSTGKTIDSMMCSGIVMDSRTLLPLENIVIGFYSDLSDSAVYKSFPAAMARSDKWGYYVVRNMKKEPYRVYAFRDDNNNNIYDPENEQVAFNDSLIVPNITMSKERDELKYVNIKDTVRALARPSQLELYLFKEKSKKQYIKEKERPERKMAYITFAAPNVKIDSIGFRGIDSSKVIKQFNITRDSLVLWINDTTMFYPPDTLMLDIKYLKTDTLNNLVSSRESFNLVAPKIKKEPANTKKPPLAPGQKPIRKDLLKLEIKADPSMIEQEGFRLEFPAPPARMNLDSVILISKTPKGLEKKEKFSFIRDSLESRLYFIKPNIKLLQGYEYRLKISHNAFKDVYAFTNDSLDANVMLPNTDKLSKLTLDITGVDGAYVFELTNQTRDKVFRGYKVMRDSKIEFPYIQPGIYCIRVTQDLNSNGILDTGDLILRKQPEKVKLYLLPNGSSYIEFKEGHELEQSINLKQLFK